MQLSLVHEDYIRDNKIIKIEIEDSEEEVTIEEAVEYLCWLQEIIHKARNAQEDIKQKQISNLKAKIVLGLK